MTTPRAQLCLGPLAYLWPADRLRDFWLRIADEAPVDVVLLGEVVCGKRLPLVERVLDEVAPRLEAANKQVVMATLALAVEKDERERLRAEVAGWPGMVEANDFGTIRLLAGRPHVVGPYVNVYNEATLRLLVEQGAVAVCPPPELPDETVACLARVPGVAVEVQIFGRQPLALSARCHHARSRGRRNDNCRYACGEDPAGMPVATLGGVPFVTVNGIQTLSHGFVERSAAVGHLQGLGIGSFQIGVEQGDMVAVARAYRDLLDGRIDASEARARIRSLFPQEDLLDRYGHPLAA